MDFNVQLDKERKYLLSKISMSHQRMQGNQLNKETGMRTIGEYQVDRKI